MKNSIVSYFFCLLLGVVTLSSCLDRPKEVIGRRKMERIMYDVYVAEATMENDYQRFNSPEKKEAYINHIFAQHGVSPAAWDSSLSWYSDRIDLYLKMNDSVKARLERAQREVNAEIEQKGGMLPHTRQSAIRSSIPRHYSFTSSAADRGFRFTLDRLKIESSIQDDEFSFAYKVIGIPKDFPGHLFSLLTLDYGDSTLYLTRRIKENKVYSQGIRKQLPADTASGFEGASLKTIHGFFHLSDSLARGLHIQLYDIRMGNEPKEPKELDAANIINNQVM